MCLKIVNGSNLALSQILYKISQGPGSYWNIFGKKKILMRGVANNRDGGILIFFHILKIPRHFRKGEYLCIHDHLEA